MRETCDISMKDPLKGVSSRVLSSNLFDPMNLN